MVYALEDAYIPRGIMFLWLYNLYLFHILRRYHRINDKNFEEKNRYTEYTIADRLTYDCPSKITENSLSKLSRASTDDLPNRS